MPRFTKSRDGVERMSVNLQVRLSREEYEVLQKIAAAENRHWRKLIEGELSNFIGMGIYDKLEQYEED